MHAETDISPLSGSRELFPAGPLKSARTVPVDRPGGATFGNTGDAAAPALRVMGESNPSGPWEASRTHPTVRPYTPAGGEKITHALFGVIGLGSLLGAEPLAYHSGVWRRRLPPIHRAALSSMASTSPLHTDQSPR